MAATCKAHSFHVNSSQKQFKWNNAVTPILTVDSGAEISFDLADGGNNQITDKSTVADVENFQNDLADPIYGPIYVNGSEPGDVLKVEFLDLQCAPYAWTAILKGYGVLAEDFPEPYLKIWDLSPEQQAKGYAVFKEGIHVPLRPFLGVVGVAPAEPGDHDTIPPQDTGGNIDCKYITQGSTLYLPVKVKGALLSCGDGHGAQGDGEVGGSAMETPMKARLRLTVEKGKLWLRSPHYLTNPATMRQAEVLALGEYGCLGIDSDLFQASKKACRQMIEWLVNTKGLTREEACILMSVAGDLKIVEAVDMPNHAVSMSIPLSIFVGPQYRDEGAAAKL
ncbi:putative acetamidase formamidase protein [Coleophoma cylindrospora]|uniref:Putative acetamidase formamidase protein n=1 Tax=Coleophoma cylindrospora TaxID=1849047 RepID=A0A3D8RFW4_9HELO|nr:putative acetamidase formamidase protein [Coleophoma cylindrospora]